MLMLVIFAWRQRKLYVLLDTEAGTPIVAAYTSSFLQYRKWQIFCVLFWRCLYPLNLTHKTSDFSTAVECQTQEIAVNKITHRYALCW